MLSNPSTRIWNFASNCLTGTNGLKSDQPKISGAPVDCSDDDASSAASRDEVLECHICWESFNIVENVPYVLWCGHTLCKNCILGLQWAVLKCPTLPIQLPLLISCPWCNLLSFRLVFRGTLKFPRKNYFLLWMVERMNGDGRITNSDSAVCDGPEQNHSAWAIPNDSSIGNQVGDRGTGNFRRGHHHRPRHSHRDPSDSNHDHNNGGNHLSHMERIQTSLRQCLVLFVHLTAKFPLVIIFLLIILYAIPSSAAILALYMLITFLLALPSFLIIYFAYPCLNWLVREIVS